MSAKIDRSNVNHTIGNTGGIGNLIGNFFGASKNTISTTVADIVGDIEKKCQQLVDLSKEHRAAAKQKHEDAQRLLAEHDNHHTDADHAERVATKFKALID